MHVMISVMYIFSGFIFLFFSLYLWIWQLCRCKKWSWTENTLHQMCIVPQNTLCSYVNIYSQNSVSLRMRFRSDKPQQFGQCRDSPYVGCQWRPSRHAQSPKVLHHDDPLSLGLSNTSRLMKSMMVIRTPYGCSLKHKTMSNICYGLSRRDILSADKKRHRNAICSKWS